MRRTHSETFDSDGNITIDKLRERNRTIKEEIKNLTLTKYKQASAYEVYDPSKKQSVFGRLAGTLKRSMIPSLRKHCMICDMDVIPAELFAIASCPHVFCESCAMNYLTYKINAYEQILCPTDGCLQPLNKQSPVFESLAIELKRKYEKQEKFQKVKNNPKLKLCTEKDCEGVVDTSTEPCICLTCKVVYCPNCMFTKHEGECQNFQVEFLQNNYKFRQCSKCKNVIEKNQGCNHITCRCGHQFCYVCGADWDKDPCRFGVEPAPPPPPPPEPPSCCARVFFWIAKLIVLPLWVILGVFIVTIPVLAYIILMLLISLFGGPCEFSMDAITCSDNACVKVLLCLLFPFIYLAGIPVFFFRQCGEICDGFRNSFGCYCETIRSVWQW